MTERRIEYTNIADIVPAARNPKQHADAQIAASIETFGYVEPIVLDDRTGRLVAGHGRVDSLVARRDAGLAPPDGVRVVDGAWLVPVVRGWSSRNDIEADGYLIASNQLTMLGGWENGDLLAMLEAIQVELPLSTIGFDDAALAMLQAEARAKEPSTGPPPEAIDALPQVPITKPGDVWVLGEHRVICGDCRDPEVVARVLDGDAINLAFTSPPYADRRKYDEASGFEPIRPDEYVDWFAPVAANVAAHLAPDGSWFVNIRASVDGLDKETYVLDLVLAHVRAWGWHWVEEYCWERNGVPKQVTTRFKNQWESVFQFTRGDFKFRPEAVRHWSSTVPQAFGEGAGDTNWASRQGGGGPVFGKLPKGSPDAWQGIERDATGSPTAGAGDRPGSVRFAQAQGTSAASFGKARLRPNPGQAIGEAGQGTGDDVGTLIGAGLAYPGNRLPTFTGTHEATGHSAAFPVGLPDFFVRAYTDEGDVVFEPFVGSGSTILAAHQNGRYGRGVEISPIYVDVTCRRFQRVTGIMPVRDGVPVDFLADIDE